MKVLNRHYQCTHFKYDGAFDAIRKIIVAPKLGFKILQINPTILEVLYSLYGNAAYGALIEFDLKATITIDLENKKADAEELNYIILDAADNSYKCLQVECSDRKINVYPQKPTFDKEEILELVQSEIDELGI